MNCLLTYIAQSRIFQGKYADEIRCSQNNYLGFYTSETISLGDFQKFNKIKNPPAETKKWLKTKSLLKTKNLRKTKKLKMEHLRQTKN